MSFKSFLQRFVIILILFSIPFALNMLFIVGAGENLSFGRITRIQQESGAIYGTAFNQNTFLYKLELAKLIRPRLVVLGSSRVMTFRQEAFSVPFVNLGGAMNHLNEGRMFLRELVKFHRPEVVVIGLDMWWFNDEFSGLITNTWV